MPTNPYFNKNQPHPDSDVYERMTIESIKIKGDLYYYIPRSLNRVDQIYGEDLLSSFDVAIPLEMWLQDTTGYGGESEIISKFGMEIRDTATILFSRKRYTESVVPFIENRNDKILFRPNEGDLIYIPFSQSLFEIKFVEDELPGFYQLKKKYVWQVNCELFQLNNEKFATGIESIDSFNGAINRLSFGFKLENGTGYVLNELGGWLINEEYVVSVNRSNESFRFLLEDGGNILSEKSEKIVSENYTTEEQKNALGYDELRGFGDNDKLKKEFSDILFNENNPFGDNL